MAYYLDLFLGNPEQGGVSMLAAITGSSTRIDVTSSMEDTFYPEPALTNPVNIVVTASSLAVINVSWVGLFSSASGGTLLFSAPIGASPTINKGNPVRFNALDLSFAAESAVGEIFMITEGVGVVLMVTEAGSFMVTEASV